MANLCIVFSSQALRDALALSPTNGNDYQIKGLILTRNTNPDSNNPTDVERNSFIVEAVFHDDNNTSERVHFPMVYNTDYEFYYLDRTQSIPINFPTTNPIYSALDYEFWDDSIDFLFFSKVQLDILLNQSEEMAVTGAQINFGLSQDRTRNSIYSTLKMMSRGGIINDPDIPSVSVALPCPPYWRGRAGGNDG